MTRPAVQHQTDVERLYNAHGRGIWRFLRFLGCDEQLADDLCQETFLAAFRWFRPVNVVLLDQPQDLSGKLESAYLRKVAYNNFLRAKKKRGRYRRAQDFDGEADFETIVPEEDFEVAQSVWLEHAPKDNGDCYVEMVRHCVGRLADRTRQAIDLRFRDAATYAQIAEKLGMKPDGVKTMLRRAREALLECVWRCMNMW